MAATGDPLSDILALVGARCVRPGRLAAGGAWALRFPPPQTVKFIAVAAGGCWLATEGGAAPLFLASGDVVMLAAGQPFTLAGDLAVPPADGARLFAGARDHVGTVGDGRDVLAVGGHVVLDAERGGLLAELLPPVLRVRGDAPDAASMRWLLDQLVTEAAADRPGAVLASERLAQLVLVHVLRAHLAAGGPPGGGWVGALRDPRIARAVRLMHREPGRPWRLGELAREAGMSRTSFSQRFKAATGVAPLAYLLNWRVRLAERALSDGTTPVSALALSLGYASESAFSAAFKRVAGVAPRHYRARTAGTGRPAQAVRSGIAPGGSTWSDPALNSNV
ncbi:AraC family transcriptional regulator [Azospirillum sp. A39]|uniref:AraC family transcriptional regulator n=1 Tax=Azospirillum sp. A39 TaxID=3462279 RepID=UPI0040462526